MARTVALSAVVVLGCAAAARSACQAYRPDPSLVENMEQLARGLPGAPPFTSERRKQLRELAREKSPERLAELAKIEALWRLTRPAPLPNPSSGPVPLAVEIVWPNYPVANPARIEFDPDGDGKPEWVEDAYQVGAPRRYIYRRQGRYEYAVRVHEQAGRVHVYTNSIRVFTAADFDAGLKARWAALREALSRGDIVAALECIHTHARARYGEAFRAAGGALPRKAREVLADISAVERRGSQAIYESERRGRDGPGSFEVRFGIDVDGVWRVSAF